MEDHEKIELRSEEFREILGTPPRWIVQYGITVAVIGFFVIGLFSYLFTFPDLIKGTIKISTAELPVSVISKEYGFLDSLVSEHSIVKEGAILGILREDNGNLKDILRLDEIVEDLEQFDEEFQDFEPEENLQLGSIETSYLKFVELYKQNKFTRISQFESEEITRADQEIAEIKEDIRGMRKRIEELKDRIVYYEVEVKNRLMATYAKSQYPNYSKDQYDRGQKVIEFQQEIEDLHRQIGQKERKIKEMGALKLGIREGWNHQKSSKGENLKLRLFNLREEINKWKEEHLILANIAGKVYYTDLLKSGERFAKKDARIMAIVPLNAEKNIQGRMYVSTVESSKVRVNYPVNIRFQAYPVAEYGLLTGKVIEKAVIPNAEDGKVLVKIGVEELVTSMGKSIPFEYDMQGYAHIITEDRPLLFRFFDYFLSEKNQE